MPSVSLKDLETCRPEISNLQLDSKTDTDYTTTINIQDISSRSKSNLTRAVPNFNFEDGPNYKIICDGILSEKSKFEDGPNFDTICDGILPSKHTANRGLV